MKRIRISIITTVLLAGALTSCDDFLTTQPETFISVDQLFVSQKEANFALSGIYNELNNSSLYGRSLIQELDVFCNDLCFGSSSAGPSGVAAFAHSAADVTLTNTWRYLYEGIDRANVFIANVNKVPDFKTDSTRQMMLAQAKFLRALFYLNLAQNWGAVPLKLTPTLSPDDVHVPVSSVEQVFNAIHTDLDSAIKYLPNRSGYSTLDKSCRPSKTTAMALQARSYLRQAGVPFNITPNESYVLAAKYSGDVIASGVHRLNTNFSQIFINLLTDKYDNVFNENLMEVEFSYNDIYTNLSAFPNVGAPLKYNGKDIIIFGSANRTTKKFFDLYERRDSVVVVGTVTHHYPVAVDTRRNWTIQDYSLSGNTYGATSTKQGYKVDASNPLTNATNVYYRDNLFEQPVGTPSGRYIGKWRRDAEVAGTLVSNGSPCNFPLIRYSEVLLIFAEADVMAKNLVSPEALNALNLVRTRAKATAISLIDPRALDPEKFILELRDERARELFGEGHRRQDIIRWGIFDETFANLPIDDPTISTWGRSIQGSKFLLLPYPERETSTNIEMKGLQNPGW
jgi:hypothetical protein